MTTRMRSNQAKFALSIFWKNISSVKPTLIPLTNPSEPSYTGLNSFIWERHEYETLYLQGLFSCDFKADIWIKVRSLGLFGRYIGSALRRLKSYLSDICIYIYISLCILMMKHQEMKKLVIESHKGLHNYYLLQMCFIHSFIHAFFR